MDIKHIFMLLSALAALEAFILHSRKIAASAMAIEPIVKGHPNLSEEMVGPLKEDQRRRIGEKERKESWRYRLFQFIIFLFFIYFSSVEEGATLYPGFLVACGLASAAVLFTDRFISVWDWIKKKKDCSKLLVVEFDLTLQLLEIGRLKHQMTKQEIGESFEKFSRWGKMSKETKRKIISLADILREMDLTQEHDESTLEWGFARDFVILKIMKWEVVNETQIAAYEKLRLETKRWKRMTSYSYIFYKLELIEGCGGKIEADCRNY